jgi:hypothetical protein
MKINMVKSLKVDNALVTSFWNTDLEKLENAFLKGQNISTLPIYLDDRVPPQCSVILDRVIQPKLTVFQKIRNSFRFC